MQRVQPIGGNTILDVLRIRGSREPRALAYAYEGAELTYGELESDVLRLAAGLSEAGLVPGARCALLLPTGLDCVRAIFAVQVVGAVPVLMQPNRPAELTRRRLNRVRCDLAVVDQAGLAVLVESSPVEPCPTRLVPIESLRASARVIPNWPGRMPSPEDRAFLQLTSGTTGEPRAVVILHRNLMAALHADLSMFEATDEDVLIGWVPLYHDLGIVRFVFGPLHLGRPVHLLSPSLQNLKRWLETAASVGATITGGPDFAYRIATRLFDGPTPDLRSLRFATNGAEPVRLSTISAFESRFGLRDVVRPGYGLAEATLGVSSFRPGETLRVSASGVVSCGRAREGVRIQIFGDDDQPLPPGVAGEILVGGDQVCAGYLDDDDATRERLHDGWWRTGDVGQLDDDGHLYVLGRKRALIKRGGMVVVPRELEEVADQVQGVRFSAAVGHANGPTEIDEDIVLVTEIHPDTAPDEESRTTLSQEIRRKVMRSVGLAPARIVLVPPRSIPRTQNGKIRYEELRRQLISGSLPQY